MKRAKKKSKTNGAAQSTSKPRREPARWTESLTVKLSPEEVKARASDLAAKHGEIEGIEADKKAAMASFKGRIDERRGEVRELARAVRSGEEVRPVEVYETFLYGNNTCEVRRSDTDETLRERAMTVDERQEEMPFDGGAA